jgi:hypothetical protein
MHSRWNRIGVMWQDEREKDGEFYFEGTGHLANVSVQSMFAVFLLELWHVDIPMVWQQLSEEH